MHFNQLPIEHFGRYKSMLQLYDDKQYSVKPTINHCPNVIILAGILENHGLVRGQVNVSSPLYINMVL